MRSFSLKRVVAAPAVALLALGGATLATFAVGSAPAGAAATIGPVDASIADGNSGSLRDVLEQQVADGDTVVLQAGATYVLNDCEPVVPKAQEGTPGYGDVEIAAAVTIQGNGATIEQKCEDRVLYTQDDITLHDVTITGGNSNAFGGGLDVDDSGAVATIDGVTFTGNSAEGGGGVGTLGDLVVTNSTFTGNEAYGPESGGGGGIQVLSTTAEVRVVGSTFTGNHAAEYGGAIEQDSFADSGATAAAQFLLTVDLSTFTGNTADEDGGGALDTEDPASISVTHSTLDGNVGGSGGAIGMFSRFSSLSVGGSTLSNNQSLFYGGGAVSVFANYGEDDTGVATFANSTITGNHQVADGAVTVEGIAALQYVTLTDNWSDLETLNRAASRRELSAQDASGTPAANITASTLRTTGSVIAQPHGGGNCGSVEGGTITSEGYNFSDDATCNLTATGDQASAGDPVLGALADNGGPTLTRLPGTGSPLLDVVPPAVCNTDVLDDQRTVSRPQGPGCDVGAVEVVVEAIEIAPKFTG